MKKFFSLVLALVMALSLTTVAWGAGLPDDQEGVITLDADITTDTCIEIGESVTINADGEFDTITSSASRIIRITASDITVTLNNVKLVSTAARDGGDIRGISIDPDLENVTLILNNCSVSFTDDSADDYSYGVNVCGGTSGVNLTISGGSYEGANPINVWGDDQVVTIDGATLNSLYAYNKIYHGCGVRVEGTGVTLTVKNTTFEGDHAVAISEETPEENNVTESGNIDTTSIAAAAIIDRDTDEDYEAYFTSLTAAAATAQDGDVIYLNAASTESVTVPVITLVPNGYAYTGTLTAPTGYEVVERTDGTFVVVVSATTGGSVSSGDYDLKQADAKSTEIAGDIGYTVVAATKNEATGSGSLEYVKMDGKLFVKIKKADATTSDFYVTKANEKTAQFYLKQIDSVADVSYDFVAKEFNKIGVKCDQMNLPYTFTLAELGAYVWTNPVTGDKIYFIDYNENFDYSVFTETYINGADGEGPMQILVDDEIVKAIMLVDDEGDPADPLNQHTWYPVAYDKTTPTKAQCGLCGAKATVYKDGKAPAGSDVIDVEFNGVPYDLVITSTGSNGSVVVTPSTDTKVESAETFDAGIAMYVGMSVLAAAGSAVVLKKKED